MKEVHYHDWLSNSVMVKKHDDSWRMCLDFKDLNKAWPEDGYLLPEIDWKVESLSGFPFKCFLDAYKGVINIQPVQSTAHEMLKLPVERGVITLKSSKMVPLECTIVSKLEGNLPVTKQTIEERVKVAINPEYPEQIIMIGSTLIQEGRNKLCDLLQRNLD
nr:reverse transcriptase domain-containing protein [Tanacetum cinerariifolium]